MIDCPYCNFQVEDNPVNSIIELRRCTSCDLIFRSDPFKVNETDEKTHNSLYTNHSRDQIGGNRNSLYQHVLDVISIQGAKDLLDVGTGCGFFLAAAQQRGWKVVGIDPSKESVEYGRQLTNSDMHQCSISDYSAKRQFDVITFINVLDHIEKPWHDIDVAFSLLKRGGLIYLRFPNGKFHTVFFRLFDLLSLRRLIPKFLVFHQYSFTSQFIKKMLTNKGFRNIRIYASPISTALEPGRKSKGGTVIVKKFIFSQLTSLLNNLRIASSLEVVATK